MDASVFAQPDWYKAFTLSERAAALRRSPELVSLDKALAERRLARWRGQEPFSQDGFFARRLALDSLTEDELHGLLGEPADAIRQRTMESPAWLASLEEAFTRPAPEKFPQLPSENPSIGFLNVIRPLLDTAYSRLLTSLREIVARYPGAPFDPGTAGSLLAANLPSPLLFLMSRTLVLELQCARRSGQLTGETPEERFQSFLRLLASPEAALAMLLQYPVLARAIVETVDCWVVASLELLERLAADWTDLCARFAPDTAPGTHLLDEVKAGLGDSHRGGRTVARFRFTSRMRLVYKPRPLAAEAAFQDLLSWVGQKGFTPVFRTLRVLDRGDYGWIEFVETRDCTDEAAVRRFYQRQGGSLALLWFLDATDLHWENLIASGEHPILLDLEALFHPPPSELGSGADEARVGRVLQKTVLNTGLLPSRIWKEEGGEGVDLSGLAGTGGQTAPPALNTQRTGTDEMRFALQTIEIPAGDNLPVLAGEPASVTRFLNEVVDGFVRMARLLREHREELAAPGGPLAAFVDAEVRILLRPTRSYALLLFESFHPYALADALDRDRLLDRLWLAVLENPRFAPLILAERRDLLRGDIPLFTTRPGTPDLWSADGERFAELQPESGLERVVHRLEHLDEGEITRQAWLVHNSLATIDMYSHEPPSYGFHAAAPPSRDELLEAAVEVGDRLAAIAFRGPHDAHWFAAQMDGAAYQRTLQPTRLDLHLGTPGIALFLAWLGEITGETRFTELAQAVAVTMRDQIQQGREIVPNIGAYSGWGGVVWVLTHLGVLWGAEDFLAEARRIAVDEIPSEIPQDEACDLVAGSAGALLSLLTLHTIRPSEQLLEVARQCGNRVLTRAIRQERGLGWHLPVAGPVPLAGLAHGVAGIAWPLLRLAAITGDSRYRDTALSALEYERSLYRPDRRNWPDLRAGTIREGATEPHFMWAWCHGAPGIGLGRLASLPYLEDAAIRSEIETAVESTLDHGFGSNHCLCHGDLGNLELVALAAERLGRPDWGERVGPVAGGILAGLRRHGRLFGIPGRTEPPGLMIGLAGIGYGCLRLAAPQRVPSVLILDGPR